MSRADPAVYGSMNCYELGKKLGSGQFSTVYSAVVLGTREKVAIKKVPLHDIQDSKARADCLKETDLLRQLDHPNIIHCFAAFLENDELNIVLELADAGDLLLMIKHFEKNNKRLPEKVIWKYFVQVCSALEHMHSRRVMHRDLKPANIFVTRDGTVKLGDLGLGRFFSTQTRAAQSLLGTPYYMSPERLHESAYDFKSDIWSLGCILYELAALHSPFYGKNMNLSMLLRKIEKCEYPPLPTDIYSDDLRDLVDQCIKINPEERPDIAAIHKIARGMHNHYSK
eukprot:Opistho-2@96206